MLTPETATELLKLLIPLLPIIATYLVKEYHYTSQQKFYISIAFSIMVGFLQAFAENNLTFDNIVMDIVTVIGLSQIYYRTLYKQLEKFVDPKEHLISEVKEKQLRPQLEQLSEDTAKNVVSKKTNTHVQTTIQIKDTL